MIVVKVGKQMGFLIYIFINYFSYHLTEVSIVSISQYFCVVQCTCDNEQFREKKQLTCRPM